MMWCMCNCKRGSPLSASVEECCLAAQCIMRSTEKKNRMHFEELYVKLSSVFFCSNIFNSSLSPPSFFLKRSTPESSGHCLQNKHFSFQNQSPAFWLCWMTLPPNILKYVMVCRACKLNSQGDSQRQTKVPVTRETFLADESNPSACHFYAVACFLLTSYLMRITSSFSEIYDVLYVLYTIVL